MTTTKIIPDAYTEYEDGHIGAVAPSLANVEAKIGAAMGGLANRLYVFSGPDAKAQAKLVFRGGPLLKSIEEAFDAGSSTIYAWRVGQTAKASLDLQRKSGGAGIRLVAREAGDYWNRVNVTVGQEIAELIANTWYLNAAANTLVLLDEDGQQERSVDLSTHFTAARGCAIQFGDDPENDHFLSVWVGGTNADGHEILRHFDADGTLIPEHNLDLSTVITAEQITAIPFVMINEEHGSMIMVSTPTKLYVFDQITAQPAEPSQTIDYATLGMTTPAVSGGSISFLVQGGQPTQPDGLYVLDPGAQKIFKIGPFGPGGDPSSIMRTIDIAGITNSGQSTGLTLNILTGDFQMCLRDADDAWRIIRFPSFPNAPTDQSIVETFNLGHPIQDVSFTIEEMIFDTVVTLWDDNLDDPPQHVFRARTNQALAGIITGGQSLVEAQFVAEGELDNIDDPQTLGGGSDGLNPTNGDYLHALELSEARTEISWVQCIGATGADIWNSILVHCDRMLDVFLSERFAVLECPAFTSNNEIGSTGYVGDLQAYVDSIVSRMATVANKNGVVFAGGADFLGSDGVRYTAGSLTSACAGVMASLEVQQSLINKQVPNVLALVPEFSPGHVQQLIQARVNCVRLKPGRGYIIAHSLTAAPPASDYSRVNDLRAVYYGGKSAREAAQPLVGEENDEEGNGLRLLESFMSRPLDVMEDHGQIDDYEIEAISSDNDRLLGDVYVNLGIQPLRAMEKIYTKVFLK